LIFLIFSDVWFNCLADLYIDCFQNCLICYIYYHNLQSHCLEFITTDCQFLIPGNIQAYRTIGCVDFSFLRCSQLISQLVSVIYFWLFLF